MIDVDSQLPKKILIVEDSPDLMQTMKTVLEWEGYEIFCANNGKDALAFLEASTQLPNLILLDMMMPEMNGFQFSQNQKLNPRIADIPVILMTADSNAEVLCKKMGATTYIKKPVDLEDIFSIVRKTLS